MRFSSLLMVLAMASTARPAPAESSVAAPAPPVAKRVDKVVTLHGEARSDPYFWLRDKPNPDVAAYLEAENAYTAAVMKPTEPLQGRSTTRCSPTSRRRTSPSRTAKAPGCTTSAPRRGSSTASTAGRSSPTAPSRSSLDLNELAKGQKFMALGGMP